MNIDINIDVLGFFAPKHYGKTYLVKTIYKPVASKCIILDTNDEYDDFAKAGADVVKPKDFSPDELNEFILYARKYKNKVVIVDDIDMYHPQRAEELAKLCINGRHQGLGVVWISRRPKLIDNRLILNSDFLFLGYPVLPQDLQYIKSLTHFFDEEKYNNMINMEPKDKPKFYSISIKERKDDIVYV